METLIKSHCFEGCHLIMVAKFYKVCKTSLEIMMMASQLSS